MHSTKKKKKRGGWSQPLRTGGYVTSMATVFSDRLFRGGFSCSWFSLMEEDTDSQRRFISKHSRCLYAFAHLGATSSGEAEAAVTLGF